jgi:hypothetical protein
MSNDIIFVFFCLLVGILYLIPPAIAIWRKHPYCWPIVAISLAAGWTGAGYLAALVWAVWPLNRLLNKKEQGSVSVPSTPSEEKTEEIGELKRIFQMAYYQRATTVCMLFSILAVISRAFFSNENDAFIWTGILATPVLIYGAYAYFRFLFALCRWWTPALLLISLVPFVVLAVLYISSGVASDIYRNHGLHAGMMGLTSKSYQELKKKLSA